MAMSMGSRVGICLLLASRLAWALIDPNAGGGPFGGVPATVPGLIEAEEFDVGGEGVAYSDTTARNINNVFRPDEAVDLANLDGGFSVGSIIAGEYLRYTVEVTKDVEAFVFIFRVASKSNNVGKFRLVAGGTGCGDFEVDLTGRVSVPATGGFGSDNYKLISGEGGGLKAGLTFLWLCIEGKSFNIDSFVLITPLEPTPEPTDPHSSGPFGGVPATIPGLIEAENFDYGGNGVGYSDNTPANIRNVFRRDEAVDVEILDDGFTVGSIVSGEFLRYTVDVTRDVKEFVFIFRVASDRYNEGKFRIVSGGTGCDDYTVDLTQRVIVPNTGGFGSDNYRFVTGLGEGLKAGTTMIWLCVLRGVFNIDSFVMTLPVEELVGPFGGVPATVPGLIEAEEFDFGGQGVGYSDSTPGNKHGAFRPKEDVDINALDVGYNIGNIAGGEYLRYTVNVTKHVDSFNFHFLVASGDGVGSVRVVSGGTGCKDFTTDLSGLVKVPNTGSWTNYKPIAVSGGGDGGLRAGKNMIWLCMVSAGLNIDSFAMTIPNIALEGPFRGVPATVPGVIEAEEFDYGRQDTQIRLLATKKGYAFRPNEDVDIHALDVGYNVGWVDGGEYLRYTVDVSKDVDSFDFNFLVSSGNGLGSVRVVSGGTGCKDFTTDLSGVVAVPNTGSFAKHKNIAVSGGGDGGLRAGKNIIWLCMVSTGLDIDSFAMTIPNDELEGPFRGVPATVPGVIEAEEFDYGGQGVGYSDSTAGNKKGAFRPNEDVDIHALDVGYNVGWVDGGEYLRYTVDVSKDVDSFDFNFLVSSGNGLGSVRVVSGGTGCKDFTTDLSGVVAVPNTGGFAKYKNVAVSGGGDGSLSAGENMIWLCMLKTGLDIDSFTMTLP